MGGDVEIQRVAVVMRDAAPIDANLVGPGTLALVVPVRTVIDRIAQVGVVEVKTTHLVVVARCSMHVRSAGDDAEHQVQNTAAERESPAHPADCTRGRGAAKVGPFRTTPSVRSARPTRLAGRDHPSLFTVFLYHDREGRP